MKNIVLLLVLLLPLAGCAAVPFAPTPAVPTTERNAADLLAGRWDAGERVWLLRQTVLFEMRGTKVPMSGILRLDTGQRQARLVGLNDLGVKLFDIAVDPQGHTQHYLFPELSRIPGVSGAIAEAVRHIFLEPQPAAGDSLTIGATEYRLSRHAEGKKIVCVFGGPGAQLLEKRVDDEGGGWRARYYDYRPAGDAQVPGGILLEDARGGYRLTLWLEKAKADHD